jgi:hypothetical protein
MEGIILGNVVPDVVQIKGKYGFRVGKVYFEVFFKTKGSINRIVVLTEEVGGILRFAVPSWRRYTVECMFIFILEGWVGGKALRVAIGLSKVDWGIHLFFRKNSK